MEPKLQDFKLGMGESEKFEPNMPRLCAKSLFFFHCGLLYITYLDYGTR